MRTRRVWLWLLFLYVVVDFSDPSSPGVFFFDSEQLFVDAAVTHAKVTPLRIAPAPRPSREDATPAARNVFNPLPDNSRASRHSTRPARPAIRSDLYDRSSASASTLEDH